MSDKQTRPVDARREMIRHLRTLARRIDRGEAIPLMIATAEPKDGNWQVDAQSVNMSPAGMLYTLGDMFKLVTTRASQALGRDGITPEMREEDGRCMLIAIEAKTALTKLLQGERPREAKT